MHLGSMPHCSISHSLIRSPESSRQVQGLAHLLHVAPVLSLLSELRELLAQKLAREEGGDGGGGGAGHWGKESIGINYIQWHTIQCMSALMQQGS